MLVLDIHQSNRIKNMNRQQLKAAIKSQGLTNTLKKRGFNLTASNEVMRSVLLADVNHSHHVIYKPLAAYNTCEIVSTNMTDEDIFDAITIECSKPFVPSPFVKHLLSGKSFLPKVNKEVRKAFKKC